MNLRSVDLNLLTVFDAVITEGNMSRAAQKIGMSQPALSLGGRLRRGIAQDPVLRRVRRATDDTVDSVALVADHFHHGVVEISCAKSEHG